MRGTEPRGHSDTQTISKDAQKKWWLWWRYRGRLKCLFVRLLFWFLCSAAFAVFYFPQQIFFDLCNFALFWLACRRRRSANWLIFFSLRCFMTQRLWKERERRKKLTYDYVGSLNFLSFPTLVSSSMQSGAKRAKKMKMRHWAEGGKLPRITLHFHSLCNWNCAGWMWLQKTTQATAHI